MHSSLVKAVVWLTLFMQVLVAAGPRQGAVVCLGSRHADAVEPPLAAEADHPCSHHDHFAPLPIPAGQEHDPNCQCVDVPLPTNDGRCSGPANVRDLTRAALPPVSLLPTPWHSDAPVLNVAALRTAPLADTTPALGLRTTRLRV